ncbi:MAG: MFS transporter [Sphingobium sp.]
MSGRADGDGAGAAQAGTRLDSPYAWYVLGLLTCAYALAYIDRQLLNLVVDPVRRSLTLSDVQFSYIQGAAFICAYIGAAPFFGRLVDVTNRRNILLFGVCMWSLCTLLCGRADTFWGLAAARFGVGLSEACVFPVAWSLIPEYFSMRRSPRALAIFTLGGQLGGGLSLVAGGAVLTFAQALGASWPSLSGLEGWQVAFIVIGLPGFLFAALLLTMREPPRRQTLKSENTDKAPSLREALAILWEKRAFYGRIYLGIGAVGIVFLGVPSWYPTYMIRVHGMAPAMVGYSMGVVILLFGAVGTLCGPFVSQFFEKRGMIDAPLRIAAISTVGMFGFCAAIPLASSPTQAIAILAGIIFFTSFPTSIIAFATQLATMGRMRGTVASFYTMSAQIVGYGIGPTIIALTTDRIFADKLMIGHSLQLVCGIASLIAGFLLFGSLKPYRRLASAQRSDMIE